MLERINLILKSRNLNAAQFADEIGVQRSSVSHILTGRNNASLDFVLKLLQRYPEIDTDWFLTGKGGMIRSKNAAEQPSKEQVSDAGGKTMGNTQLETTGDLFHHLIEPEQINESISTPTTISPAAAIEPKTSEIAQKKPDVSGDQTPSARHIEKIVIFYSDKSFSEYRPES